MNKQNQRAENREQIVFEPEFSEFIHSEVDVYVNFVSDGDGKYSAKLSPKDSEFVKELKSKSDSRNDAFDYGREVITRYKRLIVVAELAFILNGEGARLDPDYLEVIKNADVTHEEGVG